MDKQITEKTRVIMRPAVAETLRAIKPGSSATFSCGELTSYASACGRVSQLNNAAGKTIYSIKSTDNGATYTITRAAE